MKFSLKTRDFVNIGIFLVIYIIIFYGFGMLGIFAPWLMFVGWTLGILLDGIVLVLLMSRVPKMGALTIVGVFVALVMLPGGHSPWVLLACPILGFIADMVQSQMGHAKRLEPKRAIAAYTIFTIWFSIPLIPYLTANDAVFTRIGKQFGAAYEQQLRALFQPWVLAIWVVCIIILAIIGGYIGVKANAKHFKRAGLAK